MALRVLLADESSTIKKVFQLALQDFGVEVRPVNVGVDVVPVAQTFKPDIIFADVLLQKKSGYDVALDVKQDSTLKGVPVVIMWSGFMELDEDKFQACLANAQLEKPFDVSALRKLVTELVPRTQTQRLSQFLEFPKMPEIEDKAPPPAPPEEASNEEFSSVPLPKIKGGAGEKYRMNLKPEELEPEHIPVDYELPQEKVAVDDVLKVDDGEDEPFAIKEPKRATAKAAPIPEPEDDELLMVDDGDSPNFGDATVVTNVRPTESAPAQLSAEQIEKIIREQSAEIIESVVWKVVPDLAAQIIERELNKLLKERDAESI